MSLSRCLYNDLQAKIRQCSSGDMEAFASAMCKFKNSKINVEVSLQFGNNKGLHHTNYYLKYTSLSSL